MANKVVYHELVTADLNEALGHYQKISPRFAEEFVQEFRRRVETAAENPTRCHFQREFRRINLNRFPYHVLFKLLDSGIRIVVLRHNKRHPDHGMDRT